MFRTVAFTGLIAATLLGAAAQAAEPGPLLVNRAGDQTIVYGRSSNLVGGAHRNADGSVTYLSQPQRQGGPANPLDQASQGLNQAW